MIDDIKAMKEYFRVLSPNGWGVIMVPLDLTTEKTIVDFTLSPEERLRHSEIQVMSEFTEKILKID